MEEDRMVFSAITFVATLLLALVYILGGHVRFHVAHRRRWLSFAAGVATAYVFVHLLPELYEAQKIFTRLAGGRALPFPERRVYTSALIGFVVFYGLQNMLGSSLSREHGGAPERSEGPVYWAHIGGFCIYSAMISYVMVRESERGPLFLLLYLVAMSLHFLATDHLLRREHGAIYEEKGRWVLAAGVLAGWVIAEFSVFSEPILATLMGFVGGGVVMNTMLTELPGEGEGRFWYFFAGAAGYALLLLPL
jgi:zinc transporter ZupT